MIGGITIMIQQNQWLFETSIASGDYMAKKGRWDWRNDDNSFPRIERVGRSRGNSPRNNQDQNRQIDSLAKKYRLINEQRERLHHRIGGQGYNYQDIEKIIKTGDYFLAEAEKTASGLKLFETPLNLRSTYYKNLEYFNPEWESFNNSADYPSAEWIPAAKGNYTRWTSISLRPIDRIVIHVTDAPTIGSTINWFQNPKQIIKVRNRDGNLVDKRINVSSHYLVGQDGRIVQMVKQNDIAHHASSVNNSSIGIEHVARISGAKQLLPSQAQYCSSAALVNWLCAGYGIPMNRQHILGHSEATPRDGHNCPSPSWNWQYYMRLVTSGSCFPMT
jgi:N-acetylmuramoyl-L-alanine amidase